MLIFPLFPDYLLPVSSVHTLLFVNMVFMNFNLCHLNYMVPSNDF